jgi:hypothetical protein
VLAGTQRCVLTVNKYNLCFISKLSNAVIGAPFAQYAEAAPTAETTKGQLAQRYISAVSVLFLVSGA